MIKKIYIKVLYRLEEFFQKSRINFLGVNIKIPSHIDKITKKQIYRRIYEIDEIECLELVCSENDCLIEIGGGCGILAKRISEKFSFNKHIIYEPIIENFNSIKSQNINAKIYNKAVTTNDAKLVSFFQRDRVFGSGFNTQDMFSSNCKEIKVNAINVNDLEINDKTVVLLDVEGYEDKLLIPIATKNPKAIVFEFHNTKSSMSIRDLCSKLPKKYNLNHFRGKTFMIQ